MPTPASCPSGGPLWEISAQQWQDVIDVNLTGVFNTLAVTVPAIRTAGNGGSIILTASAAALRVGLHLGDCAALRRASSPWRKRWPMRLPRKVFG